MSGHGSSLPPGAPTPFPCLQTSVSRAQLRKWQVQPKDEIRYRKQVNRKLKGLAHTLAYTGAPSLQHPSLPPPTPLFLICKSGCNAPSINIEELMGKVIQQLKSRKAHTFLSVERANSFSLLFQWKWFFPLLPVQTSLLL